MKTSLIVTMGDGSRWSVPVYEIAKNRAISYMSEFGLDFKRSMNEDTIPLFEQSPNEIREWAANNMDWEDVSDVATRIADHIPPDVDYQDGWVNGDKELV